MDPKLLCWKYRQCKWGSYACLCPRSTQSYEYTWRRSSPARSFLNSAPLSRVVNNKINYDYSMSKLAWVIDDHQLFNAGISRLLIELSGIDEVLSFANPREAFNIKSSVTPRLITADYFIQPEAETYPQWSSISNGLWTTVFFWRRKVFRKLRPYHSLPFTVVPLIVTIESFLFISQFNNKKFNEIEATLLKC